MRILLTITSLLALLAVAFLYANMGSHEQTVAVVKEDLANTARSIEAKAALVNQFGRDATHIRVVVDGQAASLSGEVDDRSTLELSPEVLRSLDGIVVVHNFLEQKPGVVAANWIVSEDERETQDAILETKVKDELASNVGKLAMEITVEASDGVVSLRGDVPDDERHVVAVRTARAMPEVTRVIDLLEVAS